MTREERREQMEPQVVERLRARLARIKVAIAAKRVQELAAETLPPNVIEAALLRARLEGGPKRGPHRNGA